MRSRRTSRGVHVIGWATLLGASLAALFSLVAVSPALGIELEPEAIDLIHVEAPAAVRLPAQATEAWYSLDHPNYGEETQSTALELGIDASDVGTQVSNDAYDLSKDASEPSEDSQVEELIRDCVKEGLQNAAWDLWWSTEHEQPFDLAEETNESILQCLNEYISMEPNTAAGIAETLTSSITQGAIAVLERDNDLAGLADWMNVVNYYFIAQ